VSDVERVAQTEPNFFGHDGRECGEHRTVGPHRAWCFDCSEWCYPGIDAACKGCELPSLRAALDEANTDKDEAYSKGFEQCRRRAVVAEAELEVANQNLRTLEKTVANLESGLRYEQSVRERVAALCDEAEKRSGVTFSGRPFPAIVGASLIRAALAGEGSEQLPAKPGGDDDA
jgi:hypothetical protein